MQVPDRLGKYRVVDTLGQGAMGVVYKGFDDDIRRTVALKVLHPSLLEERTGDEMIVRFRQEAQAAAHCMHANIVTIFDYGVSAGFHYIAMEFLEGINLKTLLKKEKKLPYRQAADIMLQVLSALEYTHERGVIHRDIKPANIMIHKNGRVKVADFGIARMGRSDLTRVGIAIGTPSYMAPECLLGRPVDSGCDLYAVGIVLGELLIGEHFQQENRIDNQALKMKLHRAIRETDIAENLYIVLNKALHFNPSLRFNSAKEFSKQLSVIISPGEKHVPDMDELAATVLRTSQIRIDEPKSKLRLPESDTSLSPLMIDQITQELTPYVGPMASLLVKKYAKDCTDIDELLSALAAHIPNSNEQTQFRSSVNTSGLSATAIIRQQSHINDSGKTSKPETGLKLSAQQVQEISNILVHYIGPLAPRIINRVQRESQDWLSFCQRLSENIPGERDKNALLNQLKTIRRH